MFCGTHLMAWEKDDAEVTLKEYKCCNVQIQ